MNSSVLTPQEKLIFSLREIFEEAGYRKYKMSKFESYDLYSRYKDFLVSPDIISFTDTNGSLKALKPDVTLSIIKGMRADAQKTEKLYYNESVYRPSGAGFKEMMQCGLECIGAVDEACEKEVLLLAEKALKIISKDSVLKITEEDSKYYSGISFKGYINGVPDAVLSGGRYDGIAKRMGKDCGAIGFAVYLDVLERFLDSNTVSQGGGMLKVALPKGRLGEKVYGMFAGAGFECPEAVSGSRKLIFENPEKGISFFWVKPSDVAVYVERGAADIGVCGKDILMESGLDISELLDLNTGKCRMSVASKKDFKDDYSKTLRVATKFEKVAADYYASVGRDIDIIRLNGSIELAPLLGLSDVIVDIVETGTTLKENGLVEFEKISDISARLIANKASMEFKGDIISRLVDSLGKQVEND